MRARLFILVGTLCVAGLLVAGLGSGTASAAFPGVNGKIVFEGAQTRSGPWGLWVGNADGTGTMRPVAVDVTADRLEDPTWSPDGTEIAFSRWGKQEPGIWVMNADGSGKRRVTNGPDEAPTWSPDGTRIAFQRDLRTWRRSTLAQPGIYVMNTDGSGQTALGGGSRPAWSPDGTKIAFDGISVMNADGSDERALKPSWPCSGGSSPDWSPDGTKIAFVRVCDTVHCDGICISVAVMNADGSNDTDITDFGFDFNPAWSPDGTKIAFTHCDYEPEYIPCPKDGSHIWVMNPDGSEQRNVTSRFYYADEVDWQPLPLSQPAARIASR